MPRYLIERTMPAGAVDQVTEEVTKSIHTNNAVFGVKWIHTYMSRDKTKTFCIYEGPNENAVREANARNNLPVERVVEIPLDFTAG